MRIRTYQRQLGLAPVPSVQEQPNLPAGDFGATAGRIVGNIAERLQQIQNDTEDARTLELYNKFKQDSTQYHEDPDKGIYNTRLGYQSRGVYAEADQWMRTKGEEYVRQLDSNRAKDNFRRMALEHIQQQGIANSRFEAGQTRQYRIETAQATIKNNLIEAERNWDNPEAITQARVNIQQALELQMRGSGREEFDNAYAEIENQLGVARIRQAYVKDPLRALEMLDDPDIHLKPDTAAQLRERLSQQTEVYELQAIAQAYAQHYTPEISVAASQALIDRYGADKGQKAFAALSRIWSIQNSQDAARRQKRQEAQHNNEDTLARSMIDPNARKYTREQVTAMMNRGQIGSTAAGHYINWLDAKDKADATAQQKSMIDALHAFVNDGGTFSNEEYSSLIPSIGHDNVRSLQTRQRQKQNEREQEIQRAQENNENNLIRRFNNPDVPDPTVEEIVKSEEDKNIRDEKATTLINLAKSRVKERYKENAGKLLERAILSGDLTEDIIRASQHNHEIDAENADTLIKHVRSEAARTQALDDKAIAEQRKQRGLTLLAMAESDNPVFLSEEKMIELLSSQQIEEGHYNSIEAKRKSLATEQKKQAHSSAYTMRYMQYENGFYLPDEELSKLVSPAPKGYQITLQEYEQLRSLQRRNENERLKRIKEDKEKDNDKLFRELLAEARDGKGQSSDFYTQLITDGLLEHGQVSTIENARDNEKKARDKAEKELHEDLLAQTAKELYDKYKDNPEPAYAEMDNYPRDDRDKIRTAFNQRLADDNTARANALRQK